MIAKEQYMSDTFVTFALMRDIVNGLIAIHQSLVVAHGMLTSENCLINDRWQVRISDFWPPMDSGQSTSAETQGVLQMSNVYGEFLRLLAIYSNVKFVFHQLMFQWFSLLKSLSLCAELSFAFLRAVSAFRVDYLPAERINLRIGIHTGLCCLPLTEKGHHPFSFGNFPSAVLETQLWPVLLA